jgi:hypothetical protein
VRRPRLQDNAEALISCFADAHGPGPRRYARRDGAWRGAATDLARPPSGIQAPVSAPSQDV